MSAAIPLIIVGYHNERDNVPRPIPMPWRELVDDLTTHRRADCTLATCIGKKCPGKLAEAWSPVEIDGTRANENVRAVTVATFDIDHVDDDDDGWIDRLDADGLDYVLASTHQHRADNIRLRLAIRLSHPVGASDWPRFWAAVIKRYGLPVDTVCSELSRIYFASSCPSDATPFVRVHPGNALDVDEVLANAPSVQTGARVQSHPKATPLPSGRARTVAATKLAAAWPPDGQRHHATRALSGALAAHRWPADEIADFVTDVARLAGGHDGGEPEKRAGQARDALARIDRGDRVESWGTVAQLTSDAVVREARELLDMPDTDAQFGRRLINLIRGTDGPMPAAELRPTPPTIVVNIAEQMAITDFAERALVQYGGVYVRGRRLVHVVHDRGVGGADDWIKRPQGMPVIAPLEKERIRELLGVAAVWRTFKDGDPRPSPVPSWVVETLLARDAWTFPHLEGVTDAPVFRADGSIHDAPGYDAATRLIFDPGGTKFPTVPDAPTQSDAARALDDLLEPFCDFPFLAPSDRAAVAAMVLTLIGRAAINGDTPLFASDANTPGSGKTLVVDAVSTIVTGRRAAKVPPTDNDDETRKRMLALAIESPQLVLIDNVCGEFGSGVMAAAITGGEIKDRLLGASKSVTASLRWVWAITGNNISYKSDLGRRVVPFTIDPKLENPEDRGNWRHHPLLPYVQAERPRLVTAALTILRAYFVAGCPAHGKSAKGSFESWDRLVRGSIIWAGGADPLGGVSRIREQGDADVDALRALLSAWEGVFDARAVSVSEVVAEVAKMDMASDTHGRASRCALRDALAAYDTSKSGRPDARGLGYAFKRLKGRLVDGRALQGDQSDKRGVLWRVG